MRITVFGNGYVGLVSGTCFAELGNQVIGYDIDTKKVEKLNRGVIPIYEPGLEEMVKENVASKRLSFTTDIKTALADAEIIFLAVGTPSAEDGSANLNYLFDAAKDIAKHAHRPIIVATKSTVPVGTADKLREIFKSSAHHIEVASNPEFLREGAAIKDFLNAERVVVGVDNPKVRPIFSEIYNGITRDDRPLVFMSVRSAELTKYASNAFLATKISFINDIATLCEKVDANIHDIAKGMGYDSRIGSRFLHAGIGYGGSCFPKDVKALQFTFRENGLVPAILDAAESINARQKISLFKKLKKTLPILKNKTIAIWGLTFKPRTDDIREAPALTLIPTLIEDGAVIHAYDPKGTEEAKEVLPKSVKFFDSSFEAAKDADALLVLTEWDEFRTIDLKQLHKTMRGKVLLDGRNIYSKALAEAAGFDYEGVGIKK